MKLGIGLIILSIAIVNSNQHTNKNIATKIIEDVNDSNKNTMVKTKNDHDTDVSTSEGRTWTTMFPESTQKFIVTLKSIEARNNSNPIIKRTREIPVFKIIPRIVKTRNDNYWKRVTTRRPLMKFIKFTMNPTTTSKITTNSRNTEREAARRYKTYVFNKMMSASKKGDSSEENRFDTDAKRNNDKAKTVHTVRTSAFKKIRSRVNNKIKNMEHASKLKEASSKLRTSSEFSSEEREDKEEFIFVKPNKIKKNAVKVIEDSSESNEITTLIYEQETKKRHKRRTNVIEEENMATTVSSFKYTGKVSSLSSDLIFRNINT